MPDILVTIPAYNEQDTIGQVVKDIRQVLGNKSHLIVVVSDDSTDNTEWEAKKAGAIVYHKHHSGLADTFRYEMQLVNTYKPKVIVHTDADGQYRAGDIPKLLRAIDRGNDLVLGSRLRGRIEDMPFTKKLSNLAIVFLLRLWLQTDVTDATTGFRAFTPEVARLPIKGEYNYSIEQIIRTVRAGYKIKSVPIMFYKRDGNSRLMKNFLHYGWHLALNLRKMLS